MVLNSIFQHGTNIMSTIVTCILLYNDFVFYLSKPTYSSNSKGSLHPHSFPDVMLCPFPAFDFRKVFHQYFSVKPNSKNIFNL